MSTPERIGSIKRLYQARLAKMPAEMPFEERCECAKKDLDKMLGPMWRKEMELYGENLDPTGEVTEEKLTKRLKKATRKEGYQGEDVHPPHKSIVKQLMIFFKGK